MDVIMNLAKAERTAWRKARELNKLIVVVAIAGGYALPNADELAYECIGAEVVKAYGPAGECEANINWC